MVTRTVLLYGQSFLLPLVAANLERRPGLCVMQAATWAEGMPDVLIFDLTDDCESRVLPLLLKNPQLMLIGLDTERNQAVWLSGQEASSLTLEGLREIVEHQCQ